MVTFNGGIFAWVSKTFLYFYQEVCTNFFFTTFGRVIMADFSKNKKDLWTKTLNSYCVITKQWNSNPNVKKTPEFNEKLEFVCHFVKIEIAFSKFYS